MRITILLQESNTNIIGPSINQSRLAFQHIKNGHEVQILSLFEKDAPIYDMFIKKGITASKYSIFNDTKLQILWLIENLNRFKPDFFICDWIVSGILASKWIKKSGIPCVCSHLSDDPYFWKIMDIFVGHKNNKWNIGGVACVSNQIQQKLINQYNLRHIKTAYIPQCSIIPKESSKSFNNLKIAYCGRIEIKQKQILNVANALCNAVQNIPSSSAKIFGNGPDLGKMLSLIESRGCSNTVEYGGTLEPDLIHENLNEFNVIVLFSDYEGVPASIIEGMASRLVPVCLKCPGGIEELVIHGETGLIVSDWNEDFIIKLRSLQENPAIFQKLSKSAYNHAVSNYSVDVVASKWIKFYECFSMKNGFRKIRTPIWLNLPKIKNDGFILENITPIGFMISQLRIKFGKLLRRFCT